MAIFKDSGQANYSVDREGEDTILRGDFSNTLELPSIEDNPICMSLTIEKLAQTRGITKIIFFQKREYEYDFDQTQMLNEIAELFVHISKEKNMYSYQALLFGNCRNFVDK